MKKNRFRKYRFNSVQMTLKYQSLPISQNIKKFIKYVILLVAAYFFLIGNRGLIHLVEMKQEKDKLRQEIETLAGENWKIKKEINSLKTDLKAVERIARDELGLAGKGEIIYRFVNEEKTK
jgi:cell division protein FtsB